MINELWDSIDADELPVTPETAALIDERLREADAAPLEGRPWEEVEAEKIRAGSATRSTDALLPAE